MPTETVYGLAADARNPEAVARVFAAKQRPASHPLIVHLASVAELDKWAREIPPEAHKLAETFWPGPLTLILKKRPSVLDGVTGGQDTIAIRVPRHPLALALLQAFGDGLVAPSANRFTRISPTTAAAVKAELGDQVDLILDGGASEVGLESTILDMSGQTPRILRPGMLTPAEIGVALGVEVAVTRQDFPTEVRAPGMHHLHYAPVTSTQILSATDFVELPPAALPAACLIHSNMQCPINPQLHQIKMPSNAAAYAHDLYAVLREQDARQLKYIFIEAVPETAEWDAIRDRLSKASGRA